MFCVTFNDYYEAVINSIYLYSILLLFLIVGAVELPIEAPEEEVVSVPFDHPILDDSLDTTGTGSDISQLIQLDHSYDSPATPSCKYELVD